MEPKLSSIQDSIQNSVSSLVSTEHPPSGSGTRARDPESGTRSRFRRRVERRITRSMSRRLGSGKSSEAPQRSTHGYAPTCHPAIGPTPSISPTQNPAFNPTTYSKHASGECHSLDDLLSDNNLGLEEERVESKLNAKTMDRKKTHTSSSRSHVRRSNNPYDILSFSSDDSDSFSVSSLSRNPDTGTGNGGRKAILQKKAFQTSSDSSAISLSELRLQKKKADARRARLFNLSAFLKSKEKRIEGGHTSSKLRTTGTGNRERGTELVKKVSRRKKYTFHTDSDDSSASSIESMRLSRKKDVARRAIQSKLSSVRVCNEHRVMRQSNSSIVRVSGAGNRERGTVKEKGLFRSSNIRVPGTGNRERGTVKGKGLFASNNVRVPEAGNRKRGTVKGKGLSANSNVRVPGTGNRERGTEKGKGLLSIDKECSSSEDSSRKTAKSNCLIQKENVALVANQPAFSFSNVEEHRIKKNGKAFVCPLCNSERISIHYLKEHVRRHHSDGIPAWFAKELNMVICRCGAACSSLKRHWGQKRRNGNLSFRG